MKKVLTLIFVLLLTVVTYGQMTTTVTMGGNPISGSPFSSLGAAITALNALTITGPVVVTASAGSETSPAGGYSITATGTSDNTIIIQGAGIGNSVITAPNPAGTIGAINDAIFKIIGGDYITITGFSMNENPLNTVTSASSNNMVEFGVALFYASTTNGCQNVSILNNQITLNRTYQNTFGIYANSTHSATSMTVSATATGTSGGNHNLVISGNSISNVNMGIVVVGPTAAADMNNNVVIGGSTPNAGNAITNYGTTGTFSGYVNVSGTVNGILVRNTNNFTIEYNNLESSNGGTISGTLNGIHIPQFSSVPSGAFTNNIKNNNISLRSGVSSGAINGINYPSGSASTTSTINITNNNFHTFGHTVSGASGAIIFIFNASTHLHQNISYNTFTNITVNTTGSVTFISNSNTLPANGTKTINYNSIVTGFSKTGAGGTVVIYTDAASSTTGTTVQNNYNNFSNITLTGATTMSGWSNIDGTGATPVKSFIGNTFTNWTCGTNAVTVLNINYGNTVDVSNNTINYISGQGSITGISFGSSGTFTNPVNLYANNISNLTSTGAGGLVTGLSFSAPTPSAGATNLIYGNSINNLSSTSLSANVVGINASSSPLRIYNNTINTLTSSAVTTGAANGIMITGGANVSVFKNKIYDLTNSGAFTTTPGVNGILITSGGTTGINVYNNIIGDLKAPAANSIDAIRGIGITSTLASSYINVYYNTIYLNASSSGTNFGTSGIFHTSNASSTSVALHLRNNIIVNNSQPKGTGLTVAFRRSTSVLTNFVTTSNNNLFYAGPVSSTNLIYFDGTNSDQLLSSYQTRVSPRDNASITEPPIWWLSTTGSDPNYLHIDPSIPTGIESGGIEFYFSGFDTLDIDNHYRYGHALYTGTGTAPDIGADEFDGTTLSLCDGDPYIANIVGLNELCAGSGTTLSLDYLYTDIGITFQWLASNTQGGPYNIILGTNPTQHTGQLTQTTYYICAISCTFSGRTVYTDEFEIVVYPLPVVSASSNSPLCVGNTLELYGNADIGSEFLWTGPNNFTSTDQNPILSNVSLANSGNYTFSAMENGCWSQPSTISVAVNPNPTGVTASASSTEVCEGVPFNLFANYNPNSQFIDPNGDGGFESGNTFALNGWTVVNSTTNFWILGTQAAGYSGARAAYISQTGDAYNYSISVTSTSHFYRDIFIPIGATNITLQFSWRGNGESGWDRLLVYTAPTTVTPVANQPVSNSTTIPGATLVFTQPNYSQTTFTTSTVSLPNSLAGTTVRLIFTWQNDASLGTSPGAAVDNISLTALLPPLTYAWSSNPPGFSSTDQNPVGVTQNEATQYTVTAYNDYNCSTTSSVTVGIVDGAAIVTHPVSDTKCTGQNAQFSVTATGPNLTYQWRKNGQNIDTQLNPSAATSTLTLTNVALTDAGNYDVIVQADCGAPVYSNVAELVVNQTPTASASSGLACLGGNLNLTGTTDIGTIFSWTGPNNFSSTEQNPEITNLTNAASGNYTFTATANGCSASASVLVTVNPIPTGLTASTSSYSLCQGNAINLFASASTVPQTIHTANSSADFSAFTTNDVNRWQIVSTANAGGTAPELRFQYLSTVTGEFFVQSPLINALNYTTVEISFKHMVDWFTSTFTLKLQTSTNGIDWDDRWIINPTSNVNATTETVNIDAVAGTNFYYRFVFIGNTWNIDYWYIDDIQITGIPSLTYSWSSSPAGFTSSLQNPTGVVPTQSTEYFVTVENQFGCQTTASTGVVTVNPVYNYVFNEFIWDYQVPYYWEDMQIWTAGTYYKYLQTAAGCDSTLQLNLTIGNSGTIWVNRNIGTAVRANWSPVAGATMYQFRYALAGTQNWTLGSTSQTHFRITNLTPATLYDLEVQYFDGTTWSGWTAYAPIQFETEVVEFQFTRDIGTRAIVQWTALPDVSSYILQFKLSSSPTWINAGEYTTNTALIGYPLNDNTNYDFRVIPRYQGVSMWWTAPQTLTTLNVQYWFTRDIGTRAILNFTPIPNAVKYILLWKETASATWKAASTVGNSTTLNGLSSATSYDFKVNVYFDNTIWGTTASKSLVTNKINIAVSNYTGTEATFTWDPVTNPDASAYFLQTRVQGSTTWSSKYSTTNTTTVTGLDNAMTYEYRLVVRYGNPEVSWGATEIYLLTGSKENTPTALTTLNVYPNPVSDVLTVEVNAAANGTHIWNLYDVNGRLVLSGVQSLSMGMNTFEIEAGHLPTGMYMLQSDINGQLESRRIIKQ